MRVFKTLNIQEPETGQEKALKSDDLAYLKHILHML